MGKIKAQDNFTIKDILQSNSMIFKIPYNQRRYSWEASQIEKFWEDFNEVIEKKRESHYMGVLSLIKTSEAKLSENEVIDGQQRLTTIMLLIAAIRDIYVALGNEKMSIKLQETYLLAMLTRESICKLTPSRVDTYTFEYLVNINEGTGTDVVIRKDDNIELKRNKCRQIDCRSNQDKFVNKQMVDSYQFFYQKLVDKISGYTTKEERNNYLLDVEEALGGLEIILISSDDQTSLFLFFDSLNNRGLQLSQMDIIRNSFLRIIAQKFPGEIEKFSEMWDKLVIELDSYDAVKFFKYYYMCTKESKIYEASGLPEAYEKYFSKIQQPYEMKSEIQRMISYSKIFTKLFTKEQEKIDDPKYIINIKRINDIGQQACHSFLMDYLYIVQAEDRLAETTLLIEKMMYKRAITGQSTKALDGIFKGLIGCKIEKSGKLEYDDKIIYDNIAKQIPTEQEFKDRLVKRNWERNNLTSYTLRKYEYFLLEQSGSGAYNKILKARKDVHIEHIMPENCNDQWKTYLSINSDQDLETYMISLSKLGNLTLLEFNINESIQDSLYEEKILKENYGKSELIQVKNLVSEYKEWNIEKIKSRTENIADKLCEIFSTK